MDLFAGDDSYVEYKKFIQAREGFRESNLEMTDKIKIKTRDHKNVDYSEVHISIYENSGLGKEWRVEKEKKSVGLIKATEGLKKVTEGLSPLPDKSVRSKNLIRIIISFFQKQ